MATATTPPVTNNSSTTFDLSDHLPLQLIKSEIIPPAPNRFESAIDWLPDFEGYSWIAYGASSLLVISHLPSPLSQCENLIGPVFRQALELSSDGSGSISAVSWSSSTPSVGELAASLDNFIGLFSYNSQGSFCWSQTAILEQSTRVEAIKWTGSGDGIISGGIEVVLWRRKGHSWEIAWKFRPEIPQVLISATWSIGGASATAPLSKVCHEGSSSATIDASKCVLVSRGEGKSKHVVTELRHPMPVSMIQWRPSALKQSDEISRNSLRLLLLTCCVDGTVRLWSEMDDGRVRKAGKDNNEHKSMGLSFRVTAVIEMNQAVNGILGKDVYVQWATELGGTVSIQKEARQYVPSKECLHDSTGSCEWLIVVGPQRLVTLWAVHCLDDVSPPRFPRVTLWKRFDVSGPQMGIDGVVLHKAIISRNRASVPPDSCLLVRLLACNSLEFLHLNSQTSLITEDGSLSSESDNLMSFCANKSLNVDSHTGKLLQLAVHSYGCEFHHAVSLDTEGLLLFWSFSNGIIGLPTLNSASKFSGKITVQDSCPEYTSLSWAPATIGGYKLLLLGHVGGIDCCIVKICETEDDNVLCHKLCTIPFPVFHEEGPIYVRSVPLTLNTNETFGSNSFLLIAIFKNEFQALSWKVTIHPCDLPRSSSNDSYDIKHTLSAENTMFKFKSDFSGKRYYVAVDPCSSVLPDPHNLDKITSYAVVEPSEFVPSEEQKRIIVNGIRDKDSKYHMVTGSFDGILRLWRSAAALPLNPNLEWELVGMLGAHEGPITRVSPSDCGRRIATVSPSHQSNSSSTLRIWECVHLAGVGSFLLEDTLFLDEEVIALKWLTLGNGQLLLGICLQNKLQVYATKRCGVHSLVESKETLEKNIWFCAAESYTYPPIRDFFWGPNARAVVVHDDYFCLYSQWVPPVDMKIQVKCHMGRWKENSVDCNGRSSERIAIFRDSNICDSKELTMKDNEECRSTDPMTINVRSNLPSSMCRWFNQKRYMGTDFGLWSLLDVAEKFGGSLPVYHPEALMINIYSGNWKRALVALRHLIKHLTLNNETLKSSSLAKSSHAIPPVDLSNYFEGLSAPSSSDKAFKLSGDSTSNASSSLFSNDLFSLSSSWDSDGSSNLFSYSLKRSELSGLSESLEKLYDHVAITNFEKLQILAIIDLLDEVSNPQSGSAYGSLDEPGQRFWLAVRFQQLYFARRCGRLPSIEELVVSSRMTAWAFYSDCQENLFSSLLTNEASWQEMRNLGVGFWYTNAAQLRLKMEKLARQQYLKSKDPKACALLYIALNRLQVLAGLFKISKDEKDKPLVGFLSRNFQEEKNKAAALKNAYVLMGRHQLDLAVAFFLLGGDATSAINVCAKNLKDEQLAIVICRLVEGSGGPLEHHLISKFLLPSAIEKGDYWFASFLQWMLGNYSQAFLCMLGNQMDSLSHGTALLSNHTSFLDPSIGHYCLMLATKNNMKNSIGELNAAILCRWAVLMSSTALSRCGLPLEALECLSSSQNMFGGLHQGSVSGATKPEILNERLKPSPDNSSSNWILSDVVFHMDLRAKSDFAMNHMINLLREHPSWLEINMASSGACVYSSSEIQLQKMLLSSFEHKLTTVIAFFEQKFSLIPLHLISMILISLCNNGLGFIGHHIFEWYISKDLSQKEGNTFDGLRSCSILPILLLKATEEMSYLCLRYIVGCSMKSRSTENSVASESTYDLLASCRFYMQDLQRSLWHVRAALKLFSDFCAEFITKPLIVIDLYEYYVYFASAWLQRNPEGIILAVKPHFNTSTNDPAPSQANEHNLSKLLPQIAEALAHNRSTEYLDVIQTNGLPYHDQAGEIKPLMPVDEKWQIMHASLWRFMSGFLKHRTDSLLEKLEDDYSFNSPYKLLSFTCNATRSGSDANNLKKQLELILVLLSKLINMTSENISSCSATRLASFMLQKVGDRSSPATLQWLEKYSKSQPSARHKNLVEDIAHLSMENNEHELSAFESLWHLVSDPEILDGGLALEHSKWLQYIKQKHSIRWTDVCTQNTQEVEVEVNCDQDDRLSKSSHSNGVGSPRSPGSPSVVSSGTKDSTAKAKSVPYHNPKELYKRNGELLEALCINSTDQKQAAIASNKKGIIFFSWEDGGPSIEKSDYIWTEVDWPHDGWAGSESIPVPTCVSPGVGLGRKKGTHLGLGGATIGLDSLARPGRDFTGGGAFGIPGYAGVGASGLGWETQEEFEDLVDPPATLENVRTRAFSSHPSRPFFLVGSSNTHIYLWEFGKDRAIATYGVLPAANVPPPYALASISAVEFDHCGQRFATAASDGTVCTWQLEVGGRSNIHPTESSLCFNNYTSDVTYVTASGSIIAATGYSSNNVNVVIWDTLAPPTTSRASIMCHEGGARSLSVFANDIGSGSISPLIVTGGKGGDVGIHDFRYIATGRTKRHRNSDNVEQKINASSTAGMQSKHGDQNRNGMLWYIPKAHSGSVTRISAIPNTNLFLTGSKDGDVKLWDAKKAKLVYHWPKLHDRHTFLQPNSRGFGGVVRAAVTDIQVVSHGFLSCGGDGSVKLVQLKDFRQLKSVAFEGTIRSLLEKLENIFFEVKPVKTAFESYLPVSWLPEPDLSSNKEVEGLVSSGGSSSEKGDCISTAGIEMFELLIFVAQLLTGEAT